MTALSHGARMSLSEGFAEILLRHNSHLLASKHCIQLLVSNNSESIKDLNRKASRMIN